MKKEMSSLEKARQKFSPTLPKILQNLSSLSLKKEKTPLFLEGDKDLKALFPCTFGQPLVVAEPSGKKSVAKPLRVGVVFSGGQAAGGHNVIAGILDSLLSLHKESCLFGFLGGPSGIVENRFIEIIPELLLFYRNQGGFDLIGSGRAKIETEEQFVASAKSVVDLALDGLVIIGGDDSNTNAALLAEYFLKNKIPVKVIGVPKTIDGDLRNELLEISFGFDTACKIYAEMIGNIAKDALSAKKYYHFIKLMGRSASHIALECALVVQPNITLIGEEVAEKKKTLKNLVKEIADVICQRSENGKNYGIVMIPEGLIEFIPEVKLLMGELNRLLAKGSKEEERLHSLLKTSEKVSFVKKTLRRETALCFESLPEKIQEQLLLDRDPHGNVQVSLIETEKLLSSLVDKELKKRKKEGSFAGKFNVLHHFFGYEGRSALPSNFDANYCYALGYTTTLLIQEGLSGYMSALRKLTLPAEEWEVVGLPLAGLLHREIRQGKIKPVIKKFLVDLKGKAFIYFTHEREKWQKEDLYLSPGPIQFFGEKEFTNSTPMSLKSYVS